MKLKDLEKEFFEIFEETPSNAYISPGRVNLIGEHIDYNGGYVLPAAITYGSYGLIKIRDDNQIRAYSINFPDKGIIDINLSNIQYKKEDDWANFVKGTAKYFMNLTGEKSKGFDLLIYGNIPNGAGLSSSASIELLIGIILNDINQSKLNRQDLVKIGQLTENKFIGVNSGIMDQFAVGMGQKDKAIFLNTDTLDYSVIDADFGDNLILIMNTNKQRKLSDSKYNQRRAECDKALQIIQEHKRIKNLCELSINDLQLIEQLLEDKMLYQRVRHVVTENNRTILAKEALSNGDLIKFGELLDASHESLRNDYDVTGLELDTLVGLARQQPGVLGSRMTGAGMGGCAIALINKEEVNLAIQVITQEYTDIIGYSPEMYIAEIGDGAKKIY
ncbi:galactokinase [Aerococcaceae bacterium INB8]|uniref:Galactokinase n=1 Tax=Ruoffia halotolerans TaxID=2748684 RepID=A0A839A465_9LACT|nr:galactokinase [Ruoffia halotolerans]MBA5728435.1 galactokinase [Ruoffia halotolerans]